LYLFLAPGERISIAVDLAAQDGLLKVWDVNWIGQSFNFMDTEIPAHNFEKLNHHLSEIVREE
jgi:hypothetical protein